MWLQSRTIDSQLLNVQSLLYMLRIDPENKSFWTVDRSEPRGGFKTSIVRIASEPGKQTEADWLSFVVHNWPVLSLSQDGFMS